MQKKVSKVSKVTKGTKVTKVIKVTKVSKVTKVTKVSKLSKVTKVTKDGSKKNLEMYGNELFDKRSNGAIILTTKKTRLSCFNVKTNCFILKLKKIILD